MKNQLFKAIVRALSQWNKKQSRKPTISSRLLILLFTGSLMLNGALYYKLNHYSQTLFNGSELVVQVGFSPEGSAKETLLDLIHHSQSSIECSAYSFTSETIMQAMGAACQRGVKVQILLDNEQNFANPNGRYLGNLLQLIEQGATIHTYQTGRPSSLLTINPRITLLHDKYMVFDGKTVETGSFNFSASAENRNSENLVVLHNAPDIARTYQAQFAKRWQDSTLLTANQLLSWVERTKR